MGDPKYPRRVWKKPKRPLNYELKMDELKTLGTFGLKTKRELWKAHTELSRVRHQARSLLALRQEEREEKEPILMKSLARIGLVSADATLDDVLNLQVNDVLSRRLQTIVLKMLGFKTPYQARQAVVHGHIMIGDRKVNIPSYAVTLEEERKIRFAPGSKIEEILEAAKKAEESAAEKAKVKKEKDAPETDIKHVTELAAGSADTAEVNEDAAEKTAEPAEKTAEPADNTIDNTAEATADRTAEDKKVDLNEQASSTTADAEGAEPGSRPAGDS